jgi:hypothetical protein
MTKPTAVAAATKSKAETSYTDRRADQELKGGRCDTLDTNHSFLPIPAENAHCVREPSTHAQTSDLLIQGTMCSGKLQAYPFTCCTVAPSMKACVRRCKKQICAGSFTNGAGALEPRRKRVGNILGIRRDQGKRAGHAPRAKCRPSLSSRTNGQAC